MLRNGGWIFYALVLLHIVSLQSKKARDLDADKGAWRYEQLKPCEIVEHENPRGIRTFCKIRRVSDPYPTIVYPYGPILGGNQGRDKIL